jgi:hypothetical protein
MGTWSRPLFVTVSSGYPDDYIIDLTKLSQETINRFKNGAFFRDEYDIILKEWKPISKCTLKQFMITSCDTHKLLDHMTNSVIRSWLELFKHILEENPTLESAQFHFFCLDTGEPYYFDLNKKYIEETDKLIQNDKNIKHKLNMYIGQSESIYYFKHKNFFNKNDDGRKLVFCEDLYSVKWKKCDFRYLGLQINPNSLW